MSSEENLYKRIKEICIEQLCTANTATSQYKARYASSRSDDAKSYKIKISKEDARAHIETLIKPDEYKNCNDIFRRLLISGQNKVGMPHVIDFMGRENDFKDILGANQNNQFDYTKVTEKYHKNSIDDENNLLEAFAEKFKDTDKPIVATGSKSWWPQYVRFIIAAAWFMKELCPSSEASLEEFKSALEAKASEKYSGKYMLQDYIASEISGIGFTLACDFLKEIGYPMAKPDIHIKEFMKKQLNKEISEQDIVEEFNKLSQCVPNKDNEIEIENKQYALDKLIWLCCSGNYYKKRGFEGIIVEPKSLRDLFLEKI